MTDDSAPPTRRRWREEHRPVVRHWRHGFFTAFRRGDPVFVIAAYLLAAAHGAMFASAIGGRGRFRITPDESAIAIASCAALIAVTLLAVAIRLPFAKTTAPISGTGVAFSACWGAVSMTIVVARAEGVFSTAIWLMFGAVLACAVIAAVAVPLALRRPGEWMRGGRSAAESAADQDSTSG